MSVIISCIGISYALLIFSFFLGFKKVAVFDEISQKPTTSFSIIIPFRNEAENLPHLLNTIAKINYPKTLVEFLFVDDDSDDESSKIIANFSNESNFSISILNNKRISNSPKKDAITTAILHAKNNWIITTDADCCLPEKWLQAFDSYIQKYNPKMIVAPVNYKVNHHFLDQFQLLDFMSLQGTTIGSFGISFPFLCNGANLGYQKERFLKLNGFTGNNTIASGDDIFLFEKFVEADKNSVQYLKSQEAIVNTFPVKSWSKLIQQRLRWASKTSNVKSFKVKLIGLLILLTNLALIYVLFTASVKIIAISFLLKMIVDWSILKPTLDFFNNKKHFLKGYLIASFLYPFFSCYIVVLSLTKSYNWKGRQFKK